MALLDVNIYSTSLEVNTSFRAIIPQDIKVDEKINVLFLLHGYTGNNKDWTRFSNIERYANNKRIAVIMPSVNNSFYSNQINGMNYLDYIAKELPNIISNMFNLKLTKNNTYIAGLSMGGYGALKIALTYPNNYKGVASLSGVINLRTVFQTNNNEKLNQMIRGTFGEKTKIKDSDDLFSLAIKENSKNLDMYISCGKEDYLYEDNLSFQKHLIDNNIKHEYVFNSGSHTWKYWEDNIQLVLNKFFK